MAKKLFRLPTQAEVLAMLKTLLKTFVAAFLVAVSTASVPIVQMGFNDWKAAAFSGIAAVLMLLANYLDPTYHVYGVGYKPPC